MQFNLERSLEILQRTPLVLRTYLQGLDHSWTQQNEGGESWSPFDIIGHLIHGEKTDWMTRLDMILEHGEKKSFVPFDRFAQFESSKEKSMEVLLNEFDKLRKQNLVRLKGIKLDTIDLEKTGTHPELGRAKLKELLAAWTVHDLGHISQISRCMAYQYKDEVGVWSAYLGILKNRDH